MADNASADKDKRTGIQLVNGKSCTEARFVAGLGIGRASALQHLRWDTSSMRDPGKKWVLISFSTARL